MASTKRCSRTGRRRVGITHLPVVAVFHSTPPLRAPPREQQHVGIPKKSTGDRVNLEVDVLGKYVERSLSSVLDRLGALEDWKQVRIAILVFQRCLLVVY